MVEDLSAARAAALGAEAADEDLIVAVGQGDHRAYAHMIDRHLNRTVGLAQRVVGNRAEAEEIAQEAFLRLWRHAAKWRPPEENNGARFTTWFYRVVMNLCLDLKRKPRSTTLELVEEPADPSADAFAEVHQSQVSAQVAEAVAGLPERQRAALVMCHFEHFTMAEAAGVLSVSPGAIESLLVRARRNLRKSLEPLLEDGLFE